MSEATAKAGAFVSAHLDQARALGGAWRTSPRSRRSTWRRSREGLEELADPELPRAMVTRACPETPARYAVRGPLSEAVSKPVRPPCARAPASSALQLAQRLAEPSTGTCASTPWSRYGVPCPRTRDELAAHAPAGPPARRTGSRSIAWPTCGPAASSPSTSAGRSWSSCSTPSRRYERRLVPAHPGHAAAPPAQGSTRDELRPDAVERALELISPAHGRCRGHGPEGALVGHPRVDPRRSRGHRRVSARRDRHRHRAPRRCPRLGHPRLALATRRPSWRRPARPTRGHPARRQAPSTSIAAGQAAGFAEALTAANDAVAAQGDRYTRSHA